MANAYGIDLGGRPAALETEGVTVRYGGRVVVDGVDLKVPAGRVVALVGPSGSGKSAFLRSLNRMAELRPDARISGTVRVGGEDVYAPGVNPAEIRRRVGMVFQKPNPFPSSVFHNVAFGLRINGLSSEVEERVEVSLRRVGLWDEVKDRLGSSALRLSVGQQQRLCLARALAVEPEVLLLDEPASALDPAATQRLEDLLFELKMEYTVVIVTHNLQQAARISDYTAFLLAGELVEYGPTDAMFTVPREPRTEAYITGRIG